jgi:hypothetical protein
MDPKIDTFGKIDIPDLAIFGFEKVLDFFEVFKSRFGSVWASF